MAHQVYNENGIYYPSVTTILDDRPKPWLVKWREKWGPLAEKKLRACADVGDAFHAATEKLAKGETVDEPSNRRLCGMLRRVDTWLTESGFKPIRQEIHVVSRTYKYSGTFDAVGLLNGRLAVVDWKTSTGIYPDMGLQLTAYAWAYAEEFGAKPEIGYIVHVSKDKPRHKLTVKEFKVGKREFNTFLKRLEDYNKYALKRKTNASVGTEIPREGIQCNPTQAEG